VITSTVYKFTDRYYVSQSRGSDAVLVSFQVKPEQEVDFELLDKEFENELIDQQIRYDTEQKFGHICNLIVQQAFAPIN
jgi:His-Xaa-Ser system protein HxsD